jgi:CCR4-NOT transcription complex subunit 10
MSGDPRLWIRLAECCVAHNALKERKAETVAPKSFGSGAARKLIVPSLSAREQPAEEFDGGGTTAPLAATAQTVATSSSDTPQLSLAFGAQCCRNAITLLDLRSRVALSTTAATTTAAATIAAALAAAPTPERSDAQPPSPGSMSPPTSPRPPIKTSVELRHATLINLAYISLAMDDPAVALAAAKEVLDSPRQSEVLRFLANVYCAEALCVLGKPSQAIQFLSPAALADAQVAAGPLCASPYSSDSANPNPSNVMRSALYVNLAVAHILFRDDIGQAQQCIQQALAMHASYHALMLQAYVEVRLGNTENAVELLKRGRHAPRRAAKKARSDL